MYALKRIDRFEFTCLSKTKEQLNEKVQPKGSNKNIDDYMSIFVKVKITLEKV